MRTFEKDKYLHQDELNAIGQSGLHFVKNTGNKCEVTEQSTPAMGVTVASGVINWEGSEVSVSGGNLTIDTAPSTSGYARYDLIVVNSSGAISVIKGTEYETDDVYPNNPLPVPTFSVTTYMPLARVFVGTNVTSITNTDITDLRVISDSIGKANIGRVISGGTVTKQGNEKLSVTSGKFIQGTDTDVTLNSATLSLTAADSTNPRIDLVNVGDDDGNPSLVTGTAASSPTIPDTEDGHLALASVRVAPQETLLDDDCSSQGSWTTGSGTWTYGTSDFSSTSGYSYLASDSFQPMSNYIYIKAKMKIATSTSSQKMTFNINTDSDAGGTGYYIGMGSTFFIGKNNGSSTSEFISSGSPSADTWYTIEAFRDSNGYWTLYVDGSQVGSKVKNIKYNSFNYYNLSVNEGTNTKYWDDLLVKIGKPDTEMYEECSSGSISSDWTVTTSGWSDSSGYFSTTTDGAEIYRDLGSGHKITNFCYLKAKLYNTGNCSNKVYYLDNNSISGANGYGLYMQNDTIYLVSIANGTQRQFISSVKSTGTMYNVEAVFYNNIWYLYVDSSLVGSAVDTSKVTNELRYVVCRYDCSASFEARVDDIVVVGSENPAYEITDLRNVVGENTLKKYIIYSASDLTNTTNLGINSRFITIPANTFEKFFKLNVNCRTHNGSGTAVAYIHIKQDGTTLTESMSNDSLGNARLNMTYLFSADEFNFNENIEIEIDFTSSTNGLYDLYVDIWGE